MIVFFSSFLAIKISSYSYGALLYSGELLLHTCTKGASLVFFFFCSTFFILLVIRECRIRMEVAKKSGLRERGERREWERKMREIGPWVRIC